MISEIIDCDKKTAENLAEIEKSILILINGIAQRIKLEVNNEFSQDFSQAYKALEELKKITK